MQRWRADELPGMTRATRSIAPHHLHQLQFSSPSAQFFQILSLVLSAAVPVVPSTGTKAAGATSSGQRPASWGKQQHKQRAAQALLNLHLQ